MRIFGKGMRGTLARILALAVLFFGYTFTGFASGGGGDAEAPHKDEGHAEEAHAKKKRPSIMMPQKKMDPEIASEHVLKNLSMAEASWKGGNILEAERFFSAALEIPTPVPEKETVLLRMAELYKKGIMYPKAAAVLEKAILEFPESRKLPEVYLELGGLYRKMGALEMAISRYYMVMNAAINVEFDQLPKFKRLTLNAKMEIASTHNEREEHNKAYSMYEHLYLLDLQPEDRLRVHFRMCFLLYEIGNYQHAVAQLKLFLDTYPMSPHSPEIRYLLAKSYEKLGRKPDALREVVTILQRQSSLDTQIEESVDYWKRKMGNELANEFYEKGDTRSALAIYQALARYSDKPQWRWPAVHQIGLCFERLALPEKAKMAYQQIVGPEEGSPPDEELNEHLKSLRDMAKWRLEHLNWEDDLIARLHLMKTQ